MAAERTNAPHPRRLSTAAKRKLRQPLAPELVSERTTEDGAVLRYLEGWRAIEQANTIFGHDRWGAELVSEVGYHALRTHGGAHGATVGFYTSTVRVTVDGCLPHSDAGTGIVAEQSAEGHAAAYKAAVTDGLKRALRHLSVTRNGVKSMSPRTDGGCPPTPIA